MGAATQNCPDPCKDLLAEILRFMANIQKRDLDLRENKGNLPETRPAQPDPRYGNRSLQGERQQYEDQQRGLRKLLRKWDDNQCGDPPEGQRIWQRGPCLPQTRNLKTKLLSGPLK